MLPSCWSVPLVCQSYLLPHLHSGWAVDQAIINEEDRVVVIRFGHDSDPTCMQMDEILCAIADDVKNFAVVYLVDISEVPDFNTMYELYDACTTMFFFRYCGLGAGEGVRVDEPRSRMFFAAAP